MVLILAVGGIHVFDARDSFQDAVYKGWLFYANGLAALLACGLIFKGTDNKGWNLGLFTAAGSMAGYIASRTIGLPLMAPEPDAWFEPLGVAAMISEGLFVTVYFVRRFASPSAR
jgi:hypothetical protein